MLKSRWYPKSASFVPLASRGRTITQIVAADCNMGPHYPTAKRVPTHFCITNISPIMSKVFPMIFQINSKARLTSEVGELELVSFRFARSCSRALGLKRGCRPFCFLFPYAAQRFPLPLCVSMGFPFLLLIEVKSAWN